MSRLAGNLLWHIATVVPPKLTRRQVEVLRGISEGLTSKEIAERLNLSPRSIEAYRWSLYKRLGVKGTAGLVRYAVRAGLIRP